MLIRRRNRLIPRQFRIIFDSLLNRSFIKGREVKDFEERFGSSIGTKYAIATACGAQALKIILEFYQFNKNEHLLIPAYTSYIVKDLLENMSIKYKLVDIDKKRGTMSASSLREKIGPDAKAVLVTHLLGNSCDEEVINIAKEQGLIVIEDCAHAHGTQIEERAVGTLGHAAFYSFDYCKLINTFTGGILLTNDKQLEEYSRRVISSLQYPSTLFLLKRIFLSNIESLVFTKRTTPLFKSLLRNAKLLKKVKVMMNKPKRGNLSDFKKFSNIQAKYGLIQLAKHRDFLNFRLNFVNKIKEELKDDCQFLSRKKGDVIYYFIAIVDDAHKCSAFLSEHGIDTGFGSSIMDPLGELKDFPGLSFAINHYVQLPVYESLTEKDRIYISKILKLYATNNSFN